MSVSTSPTGNGTTIGAVPKPVDLLRVEPTDPAAPTLRAIEGQAFGASLELVRQRDDLCEFDSVDAARDAHLAAAERAIAVGDASLARLHIAEAQRLDDEADAAVSRAQVHRETAHGFTRAIAGTVEITLTGRSR
jgi:hypothetical protein